MNLAYGALCPYRCTKVPVSQAAHRASAPKPGPVLLWHGWWPCTDFKRGGHQGPLGAWSDGDMDPRVVVDRVGSHRSCPPSPATMSATRANVRCSSWTRAIMPLPSRTGRAGTCIEEASVRCTCVDTKNLTPNRHSDYGSACTRLSSRRCRT
jgi:hypothetical protein